MNIFKPSKNNTAGAVLTVSLLLGGAGYSTAQNTVFPFRPGETITYAIKKLGVKAGAATLAFGGLENHDGQNYYRITFTARSLNFFDAEIIFIDPETFYPVRVERDLNIFGKKEKIWETYDLKSGTVRITKFLKKGNSEQVIQKKGMTDNIYCFLYRFRQQKFIAPGSRLSMNLPTRNVAIDFLRQDELKIGSTVYQTLYLESDPVEYKMWFDNSDKRIPLRIDGAMGMASTTLVLSDYKSP